MVPDVERVTQGKYGGRRILVSRQQSAAFSKPRSKTGISGRHSIPCRRIADWPRRRTRRARVPLLTTGPGRKLTPQWLSDGRIVDRASDTEEERSPGAGGGSRARFWSVRIRFIDGRDGPAGISWASTGAATESRWSSIASSRRGRRRCSRCFSPDPQFRLVRTGAFPSFSPDNQQIVYTTTGLPLATLPTTPAHFGVHHERRRIESPRAVPKRRHKNASGPVWSRAATGSRLGLRQSASHAPGTFGPAQIAIVSPDGSGFRRLTPDDDANYLFPTGRPMAAPRAGRDR